VPPPRRPAEPAPRPRRRGVGLVLLLVLVSVAVLFAFVYPTRTYLGQRRAVVEAERRLEVLESHQRELQRENARLERDAEVERRAREDFGMVRPGETPYVIVPAPPLP
jgi:cell division protein FtsB